MKIKHIRYIAFGSLLIIVIIGIIAVSQHTIINKESVDNIKAKDFLVSTDKLFYLQSGETKIFEHVFWVYSNRWTKERVGWKISNISFKPAGIIVSCNPDKGIIYPGDPPVSISITITVVGNADVYKGKIEVQRIGDSCDKDTVKIIIVVL